MEEFKAVHVPVPVDKRVEMEQTFFVFSLDGSISLESTFILFIRIIAVEGVAAVSLRAEAGMPSYDHVVIVITALIESLSSVIVHVQVSGLASAVTVAAGITTRKRLIPSAVVDLEPSASAEISVASAFGMGRDLALVMCLGDNVYSSKKR